MSAAEAKEYGVAWNNSSLLFDPIRLYIKRRQVVLLKLILASATTDKQLVDARAEMRATDDVLLLLPPEEKGT